MGLNATIFICQSVPMSPDALLIIGSEGNAEQKLAVSEFYTCKFKGIQGWCETFPKLIVCQMINKTRLQGLCK